MVLFSLLKHLILKNLQNLSCGHLGVHPQIFVVWNTPLIVLVSLLAHQGSHIQKTLILLCGIERVEDVGLRVKETVDRGGIYSERAFSIEVNH
jgi:hypothetical protein